ncbi:DUF2927 domain-containing protein [Roseobacter sp. YSTF-M11]|uniref:DUF2927 domain-containing protein n=1 Tax=Roseobacter insulae TaxID=2859783 RepID=A0A9X1FW29_9RHOB|nr:DUF2927 domain-containing protein [Roseobacter insulae]MBW4708723.1 DUF2927 domain-containing protein [Roseobacter insulae]
MKRRLILPVVMILNACVPVTQGGTPSRAVIAESTLPPMKSFGRAAISAPAVSNTDLLRDFQDLSFQMESGRPLPVFTRFEGPITLRLTGAPPATLKNDLSALLGRLRDEAGIEITTTASSAANITLQAVPRSDIRRVLPQAACFVAPNVSSLSDYRTARRKQRTNWTLLQKREKLAIFVPSDASPQEVRDCLHEELAQALGPLNDLYRLPNSVFNDDNVHTVLTNFDMLILRATYAPELRSGMTREEVVHRLPAIFARINPRGKSAARTAPDPTPQEWKHAIQTALGPGSGRAARRAATDDAIRIAVNRGWADNRRAFAHYAKGRLLQGINPVAAQQQYIIADRFYAKSVDTQLHRAYVATQLAAYEIASGNGNRALRILDPNIDAARMSQNAALLATLQLLRAEALDLTGRAAEARAVRLDSLGWARYGFGADWAVRAKLREISELNPQNAPV